MRPIKFRVWDIEGTCMHDWNAIDRLDAEGTLHLVDILEKPEKYKVIPMQYTGLKDKNGVEIFEGDILKITNGKGTHSREGQITIVEWENEKAGFHPFDGYYFQGRPYLEINPVEVIGNIYENPELLK